MGRGLSALEELAVRRLALWQKLVKMGHPVRGSVVVLRRPCTRKGCRRCASGARHAATYLGYRHEGKLHWLYLPAALVPRAKEWVGHYRAMESLLGEISWINVEMLRHEARAMSQKHPEARRGGPHP